MTSDNPQCLCDVIVCSCPWHLLLAHESSNIRVKTSKCHLFWNMSGIIWGMGSADERRRYIITPSLTGWTHTQNYSYMWVWVCLSCQNMYNVYEIITGKRKSGVREMVILPVLSLQLVAPRRPRPWIWPAVSRIPKSSERVPDNSYPCISNLWWGEHESEKAVHYIQQTSHVPDLYETLSADGTNLNKNEHRWISGDDATNMNLGRVCHHM